MEAELAIIKKLQEKQTRQIEQLREEVKEIKETPKARSGEWDVKIGDEIKYFDPNLSYELTGYRPIN